MNELASCSIRATLVSVNLMILLAKLGLIPWWDMLFLLELVLAMGKGTGASILATLVLDPAFAEFGLNLEFIVIWNDSTIASKSEWVIQRLFIFLWDPSLPYIVVLQEFSLVAYLVFEAWDLIVYRLIIRLVFLI